MLIIIWSQYDNFVYLTYLFYMWSSELMVYNNQIWLLFASEN